MEIKADPAHQAHQGKEGSHDVSKIVTRKRRSLDIDEDVPADIASDKSKEIRPVAVHKKGRTSKPFIPKLPDLSQKILPFSDECNYAVSSIAALVHESFKKNIETDPEALPAFLLNLEQLQCQAGKFVDSLDSLTAQRDDLRTRIAAKQILLSPCLSPAVTEDLTNVSSAAVLQHTRQVIQMILSMYQEAGSPCLHSEFELPGAIAAVLSAINTAGGVSEEPGLVISAALRQQ